MKIVNFTLAAALIGIQAYAQSAQPIGSVQPNFAPIIINESEYQRIMSWLGDQPLKYSLPMVQWLNSLEQAAVERSRSESKDGAKK